ncbi:MAG: chemotaxis-specific protein-glutamate methyltransferase CheB [Candidatus Kapaibacterium sp.]
MKIAIVNDNELEIRVLQKSLSGDKDYVITWCTADFNEVLKNVKSNKPDLILLKLQMPNVDGPAITKAIIEDGPAAILLLTDSENNHSGKIFEAMGYGALDVVNMPKINETGLIHGQDDLIKKIEIFRKLVNYHSTIQNPNIPKPSGVKRRTRIVAIGSSTGGPKALSQIFENIPNSTEAAFVIVQHVDAQFASGLADWLKNYSKLPVSIVENGEVPQNGRIYIAGTNDHLYLSQSGTFEYSPRPYENHFRPSVDVFFNSLRQNWAFRDTAILLTGMGNDGAKGLLELKKAGWHTIAQDEATSVVYGMPKAARDLDAATEILSITQIAESILKLLN